VITFQEAIKVTNSKEKDDNSPSILLGNGFSQAWNAKIFNYANLLESANFGKRDKNLRALFKHFDTYNFELVMNQLEATEQVLDLYGINTQTLKQIRDDKEILKNALITAISKTHPKLPNEVSDNQFIAVRFFLDKFKNIYTLNYDLLMYWARNKSNLLPEFSTDDGFRKFNQCNQWIGYNESYTNQNVHFLHGGLHIYDTGEHVKKHAYQENSGTSIIEKVRENLDDGKFPLFVSEPTSQKKKNRIEHNPYLNYCYQSLRKLNGILFIYGHSIDDNDQHIFDQIKESNVNKVFVSIYGDKNSKANIRAKANANAFLHPLKVDFFQAESAPVWA